MAEIQKDIQAFKRTYRQTGNLTKSKRAAGYAPSVAVTGIANLPKSLQTYVLTRKKRLDKLANLGRSVDPQQQEDIARGAILANIAAGKDAAVQSIKLAGQDKRVSMWQSDVQTGVFIIEMPGHLAKSVQAQVIDSKDIPE